jgi:hypothetical protein
MYTPMFATAAVAAVEADMIELQLVRPLTSVCDLCNHTHTVQIILLTEFL